MFQQFPAPINHQKTTPFQHLEDPTWRIVPGLVSGKNKSLKDRFVGPLPNSQTLYPSGKLT